MKAEQNKQLMTKLYELYNAKSIDKFGDYIAADYVEHNKMDPNQKPGLEGMKEVYTMMSAAFPDFNVTAEHMIAEGDFVTVHYKVTATHKGDFMGMPATGKTINTEGIEISRIANGKVVEHWEVFDAMKMLEQLGVMPEPAASSKGEQNATDNRDAVINDLVNFAAMAQQYYRRPTSMGGGGNTFSGFNIPLGRTSSKYGNYFVLNKDPGTTVLRNEPLKSIPTEGAQELWILGIGNEVGNNKANKVQAVVHVMPTTANVTVLN
jgi:steroid delta-isomerase-like uncharacterized protein